MIRLEKIMVHNNSKTIRELFYTTPASLNRSLVPKVFTSSRLLVAFETLLHSIDSELQLLLVTYWLVHLYCYPTISGSGVVREVIKMVRMPVLLS